MIKSHISAYNPLVSVIIPSYNRAETVSHTLDSIIGQKCNFDVEIVIGDDCSTDNARDIIIAYQAKYPEQIRLLFHEKNIGLGANWATCVRHCRGKYLANCDNDDYWHNHDKLQLQVDFLETHLQYGMVHTDYRNHNRETGEISEIVISNYTLELPLQKAIFTGKFKCCNATVMYRKELIDKYVNLNDYIQFQFTLQDWNTWIILAKYTEFYCMPLSTATFGIETESITRPKSFEKVEFRFEKEKECYRYLCSLFPDDLPFDENGYDRYVNGILLGLAYKKGNYRSAHQYGNILKTLGTKNLKTTCTRNIVLFYGLWLLRKIKNVV